MPQELLEFKIGDASDARRQFHIFKYLQQNKNLELYNPRSMLTLEDVVKTIQENLKFKKRELRKILKEYDQIGMTDNEEKQNVEEQKSDFEAVIAKIREEIEQLQERIEVATEGMPFKRDDDDTAKDFCDEYSYEFNEMNKSFGSIEFKMKALTKYYHPNGEINIIGYRKFTGRDAIMECLYEKFNGLNVKQTILSVQCDRQPPKYCDIYVNFKSLITIENDRPRKVLQTLALVRSAEASSTSSPLISLDPEYLIVREIFLVQDSRPLYTYPEVDLFAPAKVKPSQDVVAADGDTATAATSYDEEDEEEGNEENQEEGDAVGGLDDANTAQPSPEPVPAEKPEEIILIRRMGMT